MRSDNRVSGISIIGNVPWGTHFCQFYQTKEDLIDILVPYFKAGLENNEFCMWVTSQPLNVEDAKEALKKAIPDLDIFLENGQIEIIPYTHWYVKDGVFDSDRVLNGWIKKLNQALANGYHGLRLTGNTFWLEKDDWNDFVDYEEEIDRVLGNYQIVSLCTYSLDRCNATEIIDVVANHQFALIKRDGKWEQIESSKRKQAEEALQESEEQYRGLFESSLDGIIITDQSGNILNVNPAYAKMLGYSTEELRHLNYKQLTPVRWHEGEEHIVQEQIFERGYSDEYEKEYIRKDGSIFPISIRVWLSRDKKGHPIGMWGIVRDITERKRVEEKLETALETLRYSEDQFRALVQNVKSGVTLIDETGKFAVVNPSFLQMFGLDNEIDILNVNSQDWSRWDVYGEDGKLLHVDDHPVRKAVKTGKPVKGQLVAVRNPRANELAWMLISTVPVLKEDGKIYRVICTYHDITERRRVEEALKKAYATLEEKVKERTAELEEAYNSLKESEKRLAEAQRIAHIGNWDWNIATNKEYWSDELYHIFGLDPQFELNHNTFLNCIHPDDFDNVSNAINGALKGKPYYIDYRIILPDGEERIIYSEGVVIFDGKNTPIRMRGIVQDITERKKAEESLASIEIARKKEIHHRIKNNLQVISSLLDLQAEQFINREDIRDSEVLAAFRESQDRVISMALIHEELYKGKGFESLNFSPYIQELADTLFDTYRLGNTDISLNMDTEDNLFFDLDTAVPLGMIINELVSNSLKHAFTGRDRGEIRIKLHREESTELGSKERESTSFTLIISDNGVGIPENLDIEDLDSLGMQLVTSLVDQLDGEFELKRNNGTELIMRFTVVEKDKLAQVGLKSQENR